MKKNLINLAFGAVLAIPLLLGTSFIPLAFNSFGLTETYAAVGDWVVQDDVRYEITSEDSDGYECGVIAYDLNAEGPYNSGEAISIPETITYNGRNYAVTSIEPSAFSNCVNLPSISMPYIKKVGVAAFTNCTGLTNVSLPSATEVSTASFIHCTGLKSVYMPNITLIGDQAFNYCETLTSISIPYVKTIGSNAFANCPKLTTLAVKNTEDDMITRSFMTSLGLSTDYLILTDCSVEEGIGNIARTIAGTNRKVSSGSASDDTRSYCFDFDGNVYLIYHTYELEQDSIQLLYNNAPVAGTQTSDVYEQIIFPDGSSITETYIYGVKIKNANGYVPADKINFG